MSTDKFPVLVSRARQIAVQSLIGLALLIAGVVCALAQDAHSQMPALHQELTTEQKSQASALLKIVRDSSKRYKDVSAAEVEGDFLQFGCVCGPDLGAMAHHYCNTAIVSRGERGPTPPQTASYEPIASGVLQLIGADSLLFADAWGKKNQGPPELMGQRFHYFESPNRLGLPAFCTQHVWAWKDTPNSAFVNWHLNVPSSSSAAKRVRWNWSYARGSAISLPDR